MERSLAVGHNGLSTLDGRSSFTLRYADMFQRKTGGPSSDLLSGQGNATLIARGVKLQGDFSSQGDVIIDGDVHGRVDLTGGLTVGADAKLKADVTAGDAVVAGSIEGTLTVKRRLELKSTANILGDVSCETAAIEAGATLEGKVRIGGKISETMTPDSTET